jgi:hypothetical protein
MSRGELDCQPLVQAETLAELGFRTLSLLVGQQNLDPKWLFPLSRRLAWVQGFRWTLEACAASVGVTRERMRQIQKGFAVSPLKLQVAPQVVSEVIRLANSATDIDDFWSALRIQGLSGPEDDWAQDSILELFSLVGGQESVDEIGRQFRRLSPPPRSRKLEALIRDRRIDLLGIIDLPALAAETRRPENDLLIVARDIYPYVLGEQGSVLAIQRPPGTFIGAIAKQLMVDDETSREVLFEGVQRIMAYRGSRNDFRFDQFETILEVVFGNPPQIENVPLSLAAGVELSGYEIEWVRLFHSSERKTIHRDELVEIASREGLSPVSAGVYLSVSPIIRPSNSRRGYFALV